MQIHGFTPLHSLAGGALIGLATTLFWLGTGKVAGISGILAGLVRPNVAERGVRVAFVLGLMLAGLAVAWLAPHAFGVSPIRSLPLLALAGLLVGFGARLGGGCTSGHGVCGLSRFSKRSLIATFTFMGTAALAVLVISRLGGGS